MLWLAWLAANICLWMNDVAAAWKMTTLTTTPIWVASVQSASLMPMLLLGLPSGALADILNRKALLLFSQVWVAIASALLCAAIFLDLMTPPLLLLLALFNGIAVALRWPVFAAIVADLVPRPQLPAALALNAMSMNLSRIVGPLVAGMLIATAGTAWVFLLNAVMSVLAAVTISRWRPAKKDTQQAPEQLGRAIRVGWQFMRQSRQLQGVLLRVTIFFFNGTALMAMLPLMARRFEAGGAGTFTLLVACQGSGALASVFIVSALRERMTRGRLVLLSSLVVAACMLLMVAFPILAVAVPVMFICGAGWLLTANTLSLSAQLGLPDWVRARGMSMQQMCLFGGNALGAGFWGIVATWTSVPVGVALAASSLVICMVAVARWAPDIDAVMDLTPREDGRTPQAVMPPATGRILVTVEYRVDPARAADFSKLMRDESRASRLRLGAASWRLVQDINDAGRFLEHIVDTSWEDHLRRYRRMSVADTELHKRRIAFLLPDECVRVTRYHEETHGD
jgi:MFS family permease